MLSGCAGWCYTWRIRWDVSTNTVHIVPEELPHLLPMDLLKHTMASFSCQTIDLEGMTASHVKALHLEQKPDMAGVWRVQNVPRTEGGPVERCWCANNLA